MGSFQEERAATETGLVNPSRTEQALSKWPLLPPLERRHISSLCIFPSPALLYCTVSFSHPRSVEQESHWESLAFTCTADEVLDGENFSGFQRAAVGISRLRLQESRGQGQCPDTSTEEKQRFIWQPRTAMSSSDL